MREEGVRMHGAQGAWLMGRSVDTGWGYKRGTSLSLSGSLSPSRYHSLALPLAIPRALSGKQIFRLGSRKGDGGRATGDNIGKQRTDTMGKTVN